MLNGKVAWITGGGSGIGLAGAEELEVVDAGPGQLRRDLHVRDVVADHLRETAPEDVVVAADLAGGTQLGKRYVDADERPLSGRRTSKHSNTLRPLQPSDPRKFGSRSAPHIDVLLGFECLRQVKARDAGGAPVGPSGAVAGRSAAGRVASHSVKSRPGAAIRKT